MGCEKCMGRRNGEPLVRLGEIVVVSVQREKLCRMTDEPDYGQTECCREGFPDMTPDQFVKMFCEHMNCSPETIVSRIEFKYC